MSLAVHASRRAVLPARVARLWLPIATLVLLAAGQPTPVLAQPRSALAQQRLGLFAGDDFRLTDGRCPDCPTPPQALWYFEAEPIAVPRVGIPVAGFSRGRTHHADVAEWSSAYLDGMPLPRPSLVWLGSPELLPDVRLTRDGQSLRDASGITSLRLVRRFRRRATSA